ncbi:hypothetical protein BC936DRAFT_142358 [Jimgerdemannia flammicorona]|uniref:Uncharacterized protein n=1 Tax=Jimgerdemannia flammicorona TaxID=994334 RepID=A0A433DFA1_9FUNG|nr:hypothetical protein BC936DRAFT_142358 [Jimgerdemannia flammicorona]
MEGDTTETLFKTNLPRPDELWYYCNLRNELKFKERWDPLRTFPSTAGIHGSTLTTLTYNVTSDMIIERAIQGFKPFELEFKEIVWWTIC